MDHLVDVECRYFAGVLTCQARTDVLDKVGKLGFVIDGNESSIGAPLRLAVWPFLRHWRNATEPETPATVHPARAGFVSAGTPGMSTVILQPTDVRRWVSVPHLGPTTPATVRPG
jgi:hypothetical protein